MKKTCIIGLLAGLCGYAQATTINAPLSDLPEETLGGVANTPYMEYNNAYEWGISLGSGVQLATASITVKATLYNESSGTLYVSLLDAPPVSGITSKSGNTLSSSDYWSQTSFATTKNSLGKLEYTALTSASFSEYVAKTVTITLDSTELADLNSYLAASSPNTSGGFDIGFDPNCTYAISKLSFTYTTAPKTPVPDTAMTVFLLGAVLLGLEVFRRKFVPVKIKA